MFKRIFFLVFIMKKMTLLILILVSFNVTQAMVYEPLTPAERMRMEELCNNNPGAVALIFCCSAVAVCGMELFKTENQHVRAKAAHCLTSCCQRTKTLPSEFVKAHKNGMVKTLFGQAPKVLKME